ncbi:hypothetical protein BpHYR1_054093 [Brachionus plicatilis]|uniref:Uncharacterized protein n=1 Tax=Brachionus plicatilis TaxID=10195 RepID=A0A3M7RXI9_BRAPC|nr:hypothetical protein BpHYR1_054093 [Brachionus plicatilis]
MTNISIFILILLYIRKYTYYQEHFCMETNRRYFNYQVRINKILEFKVNEKFTEFTNEDKQKRKV